ncbi:hypothetical protein J4Q44_G00126980 [Coregonus suidteri]|uniref:Uncharacterized protein n=1 Tax=Coregonus suidteri TaxID=861788 RepID=A0AAN8QZX9_9TELE
MVQREKAIGVKQIGKCKVESSSWTQAGKQWRKGVITGVPVSVSTKELRDPVTIQRHGAAQTDCSAFLLHRLPNNPARSAKLPPHRQHCQPGQFVLDRRHLLHQPIRPAVGGQLRLPGSSVRPAAPPFPGSRLCQALEHTRAERPGQVGLLDWWPGPNVQPGDEKRTTKRGPSEMQCRTGGDYPKSAPPGGKMKAQFRGQSALQWPPGSSDPTLHRRV